MTKVAIVARSLGINGASIFMLELGGQLRRQGYEVEILTTITPGPLAANCDAQGLPRHHIQGFERSIPVFYVKKIARTLIERQYDIVMLNHDRYTQSVISMLPDHMIVIPVLHNDQKKIYKVAYANNRAWNVAVAVSEKLRERAVVEHPDRPVVTIENGIQIPQTDEWTMRSPFSLPLELLFVGRVNHEQKGVLFLPDILHGCREQNIPVHLSVIGEGNDLPRLKKLIDDDNLTDLVHFRGVQSHTNVTQAMLHSHILLFPSFYEGFPLTLLEAQACGCVPIASRLPKITDRSIIDGQTGFLVKKGDIESIISTINRIATNDGEWMYISTTANEFVKVHYSVKTMGLRYASLIEEALHGRYSLPRSRSALRQVSFSLFSSRDYTPTLFKTIEKKLFSSFKHQNVYKLLHK